MVTLIRHHAGVSLNRAGTVANRGELPTMMTMNLLIGLLAGELRAGRFSICKMKFRLIQMRVSC
ncbi:hypothetical protein AYR63_09545 [Secundilactobacillus paracollinoides]|uniref:Uncharacterized protein n=1 Tax=Secundilactobacillus paracollinoides TaxID=240427 RepID=A0A1B2IZ73_9LACO|nr:hypothetical protein AYR63_09545 [Secundilactobacillus paracollinoides]